MAILFKSIFPRRFTACVAVAVALAVTAVEAIAEPEEKSPQSPVTEEQTKDELKTLDGLIAGRDEFIQQRRERIRALTHTANRNPSAETFLAVADSYLDMNSDSALTYLDRAEKFTNPAQLQKLLMRKSTLLSLVGFIDQGQKTYASIDTSLLDDAEKADYFQAGRDMYANIAGFYSNYPSVAKTWSKETAKSEKLLMESLQANPDDNRYRLARGQYLKRNGKIGEAETIFKDVFSTESVESDIRSEAAHELASIMAMRNDRNAQIYYLAHSIECDIYRGCVDLPSLQELSRALVSSGDDERASRYLSVALNNASETGVLARMVDAASAIPTVQQTHVRRLERSHNVLTIVVFALGIAFIALAVSLFRTRRETKKLRAAQKSLAHANITKEMYMSQFLALCSVYMNRLAQFPALIKRKLAAGKVEEITNMLTSDKFMAEQSVEFFHTFDDVVLHVYPTFVDDVNKLLQPDKQIVLKEGELLNTDLRILGFMRMGLDDSTRIAQILNYSVNTIYAYRNRLKSRAINRDTFESDVMKISAV